MSCIIAVRVRLSVFIVVIGLLVGLAAGLGAYTFVYAKGYSYMTDDPAACANCHVMSDYYGGWIKGPHRAVAVCNDCHTPHDFVSKYAVKASNGFWHSFYFTTGNYPDNLEIRRSNARVTEDACIHCHQEIVESITAHPAMSQQGRFSCVRCHDDVGHMR